MSGIRDVRDGGPGSSSSATSRSLLARVQADEPQAWDRLVSLYAPLVLHWCRRQGLQDQDAADVFQDVFQAVVSHIADFRRDRSGDTFRGWLRTITCNKLRDHFRKRRGEARGVGGSSARDLLARLPGPQPADEEPAGDGAAESALFARALELIRAEFEERTWAAFWGTAVEGRATKDVAADLAMTPGAVRVAKSRVLHRLRAELGDVRE
jgi:RNA polymerase sigma-70 factor (ECF subfamily)